MEGFRDRMSSRYDRSPERDRSDRDRYDRSERSRRSSSDSFDSDAIAEVIERSNKDQLDVIADFFDEAKDDRLESEKVIVRAVDDNSQMLAELQKAIKSMQDKQGAIPSKENTQEEEFFDTPSVDPSAKDEILRAVIDNKQLLTLIRQDVITVTQHQAQADELAAMAAGAASESEPAVAPLSADAADKYFKDMEEHVHKENVKCYRNVQAAITEQGGASAQEYNKSLSLVKILSILSLVFSFVTLGLLVAFIFGII